MQNKRICLVRPPALPYYHDTDIKEDPILTSFLGYLSSIDWPLQEVGIFDFQLTKKIEYHDLIRDKYTDYVLATRDVGESYHYSMRLARLLHKDTNANIWLYGQVSPLRFIKNLTDRINIVNHSEVELASRIGIPCNGSHFTKDLVSVSYFDRIHLEPWQIERKKGCIETSRGCPYSCNFCFISLGDSYEKRWQLRPNNEIIKDIKQYTNEGIKNFVFLDSEFLGSSPKHHALRKELLERIIKEVPKISYMILCRADTLLKFNEFDLLKKSGFSKILVGVESLYQPDLDSLNKQAKLDDLINCVCKLIEHEIQCCLTFITFNKNTTIKSIKKNLEQLDLLYNHPKAAYLGMPNFSFNLEVMRHSQKNDKQKLSNNTYIKPILWARGQVNYDVAEFPVEMESLIEIYRMLQYEWVVKKNVLLRCKRNVSNVDQNKIAAWFSQLGKFCIENMREFLEHYEKKELTLANMKKYIKVLKENYTNFYKVLPEALQALETFDHSENIDHSKEILFEDHGWDKKIPIIIKESEFSTESI